MEILLMRTRTTDAFEERWGIDLGLVIFCLSVVLAVVCLYVIFGLMHVKIPDLIQMLRSFLNGS